VVPERHERVAEPLESAGHVVGVAHASIEIDGLLVVVDGSGVLTGVVGDVAEAVQGACLEIGIAVAGEQGERGFAMHPGFVVLTELRVTPAHSVERVGFPHRRVQPPVQAQGVRGVFERQLVVPTS
jgi:hypothetical protein